MVYVSGGCIEGSLGKWILEESEKPCKCVSKSIYTSLLLHRYDEL